MLQTALETNLMRLRITFAKQNALRYTGHLDLHRIWERAARRAELPLAYSQGFHQQPKISLASLNTIRGDISEETVEGFICIGWKACEMDLRFGSYPERI